SFGRARKMDGIWVMPYPSSKRSATNFNIEDYFPRRLFLHHILSFRLITDVFDKDKLKKAFEEDCNTGKIIPKDFKKFSAVFELLDYVKTADAAGKDHI
ncbi:MAG: hypothetical protein IKJ45_01420, partial [Kiritimatiellae bacterium]|nr:hypothetical protein [Kiritimatiellia bacterium]